MDNIPENIQPLTPEGQAYGASKKERRLLRKQQRLKESQLKIRQQKIKKFSVVVGVILIGIAIIIGLGWIISQREILPPITMEGHIEQSPPAHILDRPMLLSVQKHMLEHADGRGRPGVIINYNCDDFDCESDLISRLTALVREYPEHVYLAPYSNMSAKLVLTKLGQRQILDDLDEDIIREFIK